MMEAELECPLECPLCGVIISKEGAHFATADDPLGIRVWHVCADGKKILVDTQEDSGDNYEYERD